VTHCGGGDAPGYEITYVNSAFNVVSNVLATDVVVSCPSVGATFDGAELNPCTASVSASDGFAQSVPVVYADNVEVGTATARADFVGDAQHASSTGTATFLIAQASSETIVTCPATTAYTGKAQVPCSADVTGAGGLQTNIPVVYAHNVAIGSASATASFAGDRNHRSSNATTTFVIVAGFVAQQWPTEIAPLSYNVVFPSSSASRFSLKSLTPRTCVTSGATAYFLGVGACSVAIFDGALRLQTLSTHVVKGASSHAHISRQTVSTYLFSAGSSTLSATAKHRLALSITSLKRARAVLVYGFASGTATTAQKLSTARANSVRRYLETLGVKVLVSSSYGSSNVVDSSTNRNRVVVGSVVS
jgi:hypothetical protein